MGRPNQLLAVQVALPPSFSGSASRQNSFANFGGPALPVTWRGECTLDHEGESVVLSSELRRAKLFGIEFY